MKQHVSQFIKILKQYHWYDDAAAFVKGKNLEELVSLVPENIPHHCEPTDLYETQAVALRALKLVELLEKAKEKKEEKPAISEEKETVAFNKKELTELLLSLGVILYAPNESKVDPSSVIDTVEKLFKK